VSAACLKYSVLIFVEKNIYKMQYQEGSGTPVLYRRRTVLKFNFENKFILSVPYKFLSNTDSYYFFCLSFALTVPLATSISVRISARKIKHYASQTAVIQEI
jgi:hypothetical protein